MNRDDFVGYAVPAITLGMGLFAWEAPNPNGEGQRWETAKGSRMKLAF